MKNLLGTFGLLAILFIILLMAFAMTAGIAVAVVGASIVPLTFIWGLLTGQSYARVCDNSEILYRLNQVGKWTLTVAVGILVIFGLIWIF